MIKGLNIFLLLLLIGCGPEDEAKTPEIAEENTEEIISVKINSIETETFIEKGKFFGTVHGINEATLISYTGGVVKKVFKKDGDRVRKGEALCNIDGESFNNILKAAKIQEKLTQDALNRAKKHQPSEHYSQIQVDKSEQAYHQAKNQTLEAKKNWESAQCLSPINGVVLRKRINPFQNITPATPTFDIANINKIKIQLNIPESDITGYKRRAPVHLLNKNKDVSGKVHSISQKVDEQSKMFQMEVHLNNKGHILKPGQLVQVEVEKKTWEEGIVIPSEIIQSLHKGSAVYIVEEEKAHLKKIKEGPSHNGLSLISSGLTEGDQLIVSGYALVSEGSPVKIIND